MPKPHTLLGLALATTLALPALASVYIPNLHARQTDDDGSGDLSDVPVSLSDNCQSAIEGLVPLYSEAPTPPELLVTATAIPADPCAATADFSGTELSEWESYTSAAMGWYSSHSEAIDGALSSCSELTDYYGDAPMPVCTDVPLMPTAEGTGAGAGATTTTDATATATSDDNGSSKKPSAATTTSDGENTTSATQAAAPAPRETGVMVAAAAIVAAGVWGFML